MYFWMTNFLLWMRFLERWMIEDLLVSALVRWEFDAVLGGNDIFEERL